MMQQDKIRKKRKLMDGLFYASFMIIPLTAFLVFYLYVNIDSFIMAFQRHYRGEKSYAKIDVCSR